jgi:hypothetical protein
MNSIIKPFLDTHKKEFNLTGVKETDLLEHFINYITLRDFVPYSFDPSESTLGKKEVGIDGFSVVVNNDLITSLEQLKSIFGDSDEGKLRYEISVSFIFTQTKSSENKDFGEFGIFLDAVKDCFSERKLNTSQKSNQLYEICDYIFSHSPQLSANPKLFAFFAYTGKYNNEEIFESRITSTKNDLLKLNYFDIVSIKILDVDNIIKKYRAIKNSINKTITMSQSAVLPKINDVDESFIGVISCKNYIDLITDDNDMVISSLFEDNVRYFQGYNNVNKEIQQTINNKDQQELFAILNNGVTIIAEEVKRTGNDFNLKKFQIVNGCQTSFVLYDNKLLLNDNANIIVKLIATNKPEIVDSIVKTTNRQTIINNEAFETLRDFHKKLELSFQSYDAKYRLYYERRSKQYDNEQSVIRDRIVSFPLLTATYVAVFLDEPHSTHRYYGELLNSYGKRLFKEDDIPDQYCVASIMVYLVDKWIKKNDISVKKYKYHICLMLRCLVDNSKLPPSNSTQMKRLCDKLYSHITDENWLDNSIKKVIDLINKEKASIGFDTKNGNDIIRLKEFTTKLLSKLNYNSQSDNTRKLPSLKSGVEVKCKVTGWGRSHVYVELIDYKEKGIIYIGNLKDYYVIDIREEVKVGDILNAKILYDSRNNYDEYELSSNQH